MGGKGGEGRKKGERDGGKGRGRDGVKEGEGWSEGEREGWRLSTGGDGLIQNTKNKAKTNVYINCYGNTIFTVYSF